MAVFDSFADTPDQIRVEGEQITLRFDRTGPNTGRISWNIPAPANGCTSETQAYCGILITIDTVPASVNTAPSDGTLYTADPTADPDLFAGDQIGTSFVVGAFYEGVKKGTGEALTTYFDVSGLKENTPYFVAGYAADCQGRYHTQGVFAYSQALGGQTTPDTAGYQELVMGEGVNLTDGTGLTLGSNYKLNFNVDGTDYSVTVNGNEAQTIQELIDAVNNKIAQLTPAPKSPIAPNTGAYWYDVQNGKLYKWDGYQNVEVPILNEPTDPSALSVGDYWYDTINSVLNRWNGSSWDVVSNSNIISYTKDPLNTSTFTSEDFWYQSGSPSRAFGWCGNVWCEKPLFDQEKDPTTGISPTCGTFWYNPDDMLLRQWNDRDNVWETTTAIYWNVDPSALGSPTIATGTYWFDEVTQQLSRWSTPIADMWTDVTLGYQDVVLSAPHVLSDQALLEGTYTDSVVVNGNTIALTLTICNETEGQFQNVIKEINKQFTGSPAQVSVAFRNDGTGLALRLTSSTTDSPEIQSGGTLFSSLSDFASIGTAVDGTFITIGDEPALTSIVVGQYWVDVENERVYKRNGSVWDRLCTIFFPDDPTDRHSCDLWWNSNTDVLSTWDAVGNMWMPVVNFIQDTTEPTGDHSVDPESLWHVPSTNTLREWDGTQWIEVSFIDHPTDPTQPSVNEVWRNGNSWAVYDGTQWISFDPVNSPNNPSQATLPSGTFWHNTLNGGTYMWNGVNWVGVMSTDVQPNAAGNIIPPYTPTKGEYWYNLTTQTLMQWNGSTWVEATPVALFSLYTNGNLRLTSTTTGSQSVIKIDCDQTTSTILAGLTAYTNCGDIVCGTDGLESVPSYLQQGVGTDGSSDERRQLHDTIRRLLGYPMVEVELDKEDLNVAITIAIEELRRLSSSGYRRGFMKLPIKSGQQIYQLTNKGKRGAGYENPDGTYVGYDAIVTVMGVYRTTSAFMTSAHGSGIFGQVVLQHLYNMGTFDLLSFHLVSQYIEQLEHLFASRIVFSWNESNRTLWLHQAFSQNEMAIMDVAVERTEQDLLTDRYTSRWIEKYALAQSKMILAQVRGKYSTLPGAGGNVSLNASDLQTQAENEMEDLRDQIDNFIVNNVEEFGIGYDFVIG